MPNKVLALQVDSDRQASFRVALQKRGRKETSTDKIIIAQDPAAIPFANTQVDQNIFFT